MSTPSRSHPRRVPNPGSDRKSKSKSKSNRQSSSDPQKKPDPTGPPDPYTPASLPTPTSFPPSFPLDARVSAALAAHLDTLRMLRHRNRNQHRPARWWAGFDVFGRELRKLVREEGRLRGLLGEVEGGKRGTAKAKVREDRERWVAELRERLCRRVMLWRDVWVDRWFYQFSQLTAQKPFATLGLVLLAILAEVAKVVGITKVLLVTKAKPDRQLGREISGGGRKVGTGAGSGEGEEEVDVDVGMPVPREREDDDEDVGMAIRRDEMDVDESGSDDDDADE